MAVPWRFVPRHAAIHFSPSSSRCSSCWTWLAFGALSIVLLEQMSHVRYHRPDDPIFPYSSVHSGLWGESVETQPHWRVVGQQLYAELGGLFQPYQAAFQRGTGSLEEGAPLRIGCASK